MFHSAEHDRLLSDLRGLQRAVRDAYGPQLIVNRVDNAVGDFEHQPTVWDAWEGRNRSQGWDLPADFARLFESWCNAHRRLADASPADSQDLDAAASAAEAASETLLAELYRCKDARAGRLALALDLFAASEELMRQNLRRRHPRAPPAVIEQLLARWLERRPGAESGDGAVPPLGTRS